jgi:hypothetical protein
MTNSRAQAVRRAGIWIALALAGCDVSGTEHSIAPLTSSALAMPAAQLKAAPNLVPVVPPPPVPSAPAAVAPALAADPQLSPKPPELFAGLMQEDILRELTRARASDLRPVGVTSLVFRAELDAPFRAALKAATFSRPGGPVNEAAAYRLARCLGLDNVPPVVLRRMSGAEIQRKLAYVWQPRWLEFEPQLVIGPLGLIEVAAIYWIEDLQDLGLESFTMTQRAFGWLKIDGEAPPERAQLAKQLSTMIAFDYLIGNWDRWSGGNLKGTAAGDFLYMRDHDAGFAGRISEPLQRRMLEPVQRTQRYSRSFVQAVRALDRETLIRELSRDPLLAEHIRLDASPGPQPARPVLDQRVFDQLFDRRDTLLTYIKALIEEHGEKRVLSFE